MSELTASAEVEARLLHELAHFAGAHVLDVGAGDGRLSAHFAATAANTVLVDPAADDLGLARRDLPAAGVERFGLCRGRAEALPFPSQAFDLVVFSWSL